MNATIKAMEAGHDQPAALLPSSPVAPPQGAEPTASPSGCSLPASPFASQPAFPRATGETPRAFRAFRTFFTLGNARSLAAVADQLGEKPDTVKTWSSRYRWSERLHSYHADLLQQQVEAETTAHRQQAADWARRTREYREQEWSAAQQLLAAVQCFLESYGDRDVEKMTLAQVSRALQISSRIARQALSGTNAPDEPALAPVQLQLLAALERAYGPPAPASPVATPSQIAEQTPTSILQSSLALPASHLPTSPTAAPLLSLAPPAATARQRGESDGERVTVRSGEVTAQSATTSMSALGTPSGQPDTNPPISIVASAPCLGS